LGALLLESSDIRTPDPDAMLRAALTGLKQVGVAELAWTRDLRQWQSRMLLMRRYAVPAPSPWPDVSDAELDRTLDEWAAPWLTGLTRREHFAKLNLRDALESFVTHAQRTILQREAPTHFTVPSGSSIPIDYTDGEIPSISVRLQELFGLRQTPAVAGGKLPLLLKLLSPAGRPVQITRDLVSFWERGYHEVK